ncbi:hypothetical protein niasHT_030560 [Heterodera trifolii]|uniref:Uncharacterized protein n=1 Tax=Heterodera trifolii TaxID=157864 RepID=A0ABD2ITJ5_9BILA
MSHQTLNDVYADMPLKDYCMITYNCQKWAGAFCGNGIINLSGRVCFKKEWSTRLCPCPWSNKTLIKIEVKQSPKNSDTACYTVEVKCPCHGAPTFVTYEQTAAGKRKNFGKCYQERSTYSLAKGQISLVRIEEIY